MVECISFLSKPLIFKSPPITVRVLGPHGANAQQGDAQGALSVRRGAGRRRCLRLRLPEPPRRALVPRPAGRRPAQRKRPGAGPRHGPPLFHRSQPRPGARAAHQRGVLLFRQPAAQVQAALPVRTGARSGEAFVDMFDTVVG